MTVQQSIGEGLDLFSTKKLNNLNICTLIDKLFFTTHGQILFEHNKDILCNYEDSFKIATRVVMNGMEVEEELSTQDRFAIIETFRFVLAIHANGCGELSSRR